MRTAEEMYSYCVDNGYGKGLTRNWGIKHFRVIEENLHEEEEVLMTFIGLKDFKGALQHDDNYAYALTNKRMIFAQKKLIGEDLKSVVYDKINDISSSKKMLFGVVTIDTLGERFSVGVDKVTADNISKEAHRIIFKVRNKDKVKIEDKKKDELDEIRRYKELMDDGVITREEFNLKKKELLGL